jgi:hypothetical protein
MALMGPAVDCLKAKTLLSDLLDVRRGEQPTSLESPLGNPQVLQALEEHLVQCGSCKQELGELEELGLAFSEFNLEEPDAAHFAGYGRMVHERVRRMTQRTTVRPGMVAANSPWRTWLSAVAASAAAAVLAVVILGPRGQTTTPSGIPSTSQQIAQADPVKVQTPKKIEMAAPSEGSLLDQFADAGESIVIPKLEPRSLDLDLRTRQGIQRVTLDPRAEKKNVVGVLSESSEPFFLSDPPLDTTKSTGLVGIMFRATGKEDPAEGICVVAVKRGGPADTIGLRPDDRLLAVNGISFPESSSGEIIKFFNAASILGNGKLIQVDFATRSKSGEWIVKRGKAILGKFQ